MNNSPAIIKRTDKKIYHEQYNDNAGIGEFNLVVRQKADKFYDVEATGGLPTGLDR